MPELQQLYDELVTVLRRLEVIETELARMQHPRRFTVIDGDGDTPEQWRHTG